MIPDSYAWLIWSCSFLPPWIGLFIALPRHRRAMVWTSLFTMPFGLAEPIFVPEYWNPPSLFDLAQRTGFDIESLIFCFGIGGVGSVLYNLLTGYVPETMSPEEKHHPRHQFHHVVVASPFLVFLALVFFPWNPIYPGILAMFAGSAATIWCRPDLGTKTWVGGAHFVLYYLVFLLGLKSTAPGYIARVWNLEALLPWRIFGMPVEEFLFAAGFGMYWSGIYEHFTWCRDGRPHPSQP